MKMNDSVSYSDSDDLCLIRKYRQGDQTACTALIARYALVINRKVSKLSVRGLERDDLRQEAYMGIYHAIRSFDEERGVSFYTYANSCVGNRLKNMLAFAHTKKENLFYNAVSFDDLSAAREAGDETLNPETIFIKNEEYAAFIEAINRHLSKFEKEVLFLYLNGYGYNIVAARLDSSLKSVDNALQRARRKLKAVLNIF